MRFKFSMQLRGDGLHSLPSNHQYEFFSWINKTLHFGNQAMTNFFKKKGYLDMQYQFNHFTFSPLAVRDFSFQDDRMFIGDSRISMVLSIIPDLELKTLIPELFTGIEGRVGDKKSKLEFKVEEVELLPEPFFGDVVTLGCSNPLVMSDDSNPKKNQFISPEEKGYEKLFFKNLMAKYALLMKFFPGNGNVAFPDLSELKFTLIGSVKSRVIKVRTETITPLSIKGHHFLFSLKAPAPLIKTGYALGFGESCNLGFGFCEVKDNQGV
ncbi:MAG: CRISPR-associated endoribonuclease Cas6 [Bacteroidales bacterium]|jgi:CRISPR-associated endoribonuclease Cas6|nr:CRISPR-associated endoribonuclease Cas6 [Bacteroidales bacterium]NLM91848.1 CRISPR-associated endoribonuclease Cas6 [Bacteroidales bacterium]